MVVVALRILDLTEIRSAGVDAAKDASAVVVVAECVAVVVVFVAAVV